MRGAALVIAWLLPTLSLSRLPRTFVAMGGSEDDDEDEDDDEVVERKEGPLAGGARVPGAGLCWARRDDMVMMCSDSPKFRSGDSPTSASSSSALKELPLFLFLRG